MDSPPTSRPNGTQTEPAEGHTWQPLEGLSRADQQYDFSPIDSWQARWDAFRTRPEVQERLQTVERRVERLWSIETGIIEGLYTLTLDTTAALMEQGFLPNVIQPGNTNIAPELLLSILQDHQTSVELVHGYIQAQRPLAAHPIPELHACITTAHQSTHVAVDSLGRRVQRPLRRGVFKQWPNNPTRPDGQVHPYCPPEQVDSELDRMQQLYAQYSSQPHSFHPVLCAAWLHHRFVQIHPFADGNGRVARALMNWHLIKEDLLPVAITHDQRTAYLHALNPADGETLIPFVEVLLRSLRHMVHQMVESGDEAMAILGLAIPPADYYRDDYPGWRK